MPTAKAFLTASILSLGTGLLALAGCGGGENDPANTSANRSPGTSIYNADSEPAGAMAVGEARQSVTNEQDVVLVGRVGGSAEPFIDRVAAFTIVDLKVPHCSSEENCPTPWDYCCTQNEVKENIAVIKVVDSSGKLVRQDARELLGVQELDTVVVKGQARRDESGNLTLLAERVFVRQT